jgi:hypothetical protein
MDATRSLFLKLLCVLDALLKLLESYYGILRWFKSIGMSFMSLFKNKKNIFFLGARLIATPGLILRRPP